MCTLGIRAQQLVWRRSSRVLWLAGIMPSPVERWAEPSASSPISPSIMEQSDQRDKDICCCIAWISLFFPALWPTFFLPSLLPALLFLLSVPSLLLFCHPCSSSSFMPLYILHYRTAEEAGTTQLNQYHNFQMNLDVKTYGVFKNDSCVNHFDLLWPMLKYSSMVVTKKVLVVSE